jgi:hypothetical protein
MTSVLCDSAPLVPVTLNIQVPGWALALAVKVNVCLPRPVVAEGVTLLVGQLILAGQVAFALLMATVRFTVPANPLIAVTVTVVLTLELGLTGIEFGARLIAKSDVVVITLSVMVLV